MERYIAVTKENREFLIKAFNTTQMAVWRALNFSERGGGSLRARKIRKLAQERGGVLMVVSPAIETMHDADGYMRQYFPNGVMLECNKSTGHVDIVKDGAVVAGFENVLVNQLCQIQAKTQVM